MPSPNTVIPDKSKDKDWRDLRGGTNEMPSVDKRDEKARQRRHSDTGRGGFVVTRHPPGCPPRRRSRSPNIMSRSTSRERAASSAPGVLVDTGTSSNQAGADAVDSMT